MQVRGISVEGVAGKIKQLCKAPVPATFAVYGSGEYGQGAYGQGVDSASSGGLLSNTGISTILIVAVALLLITAGVYVTIRQYRKRKSVSN